MNNTLDNKCHSKTDSKDDESSSRSSNMQSYKDTTRGATPFSDTFDLDGIEFSQVPQMSMDGMADFGRTDDREEGRVTNETEEEYAVLDRGDDYKLSIMRKKRPIIKVDDEDAD